MRLLASGWSSSQVFFRLRLDVPAMCSVPLRAYWGVAVLCVCLLFPLFVNGGISAEQRKEIDELKQQLDKVPGLIKKKESAEATKILDEVEAKLKKIGKDAGDEDNRSLTGLYRNINQKRQQLAKRENSGRGGGTFEKDIAPILVKSCLGCHDDTASGGLKFDSFAGIVAGCGGKLVVPGNAEGSMLVRRLLATGNARMPKNEKALPANEIKKITDWINAGAKFTGNNDTKLSELSADAESKKDAGPVEIASATGGEKVSFKRDIAPFMVNICVGCHSGANPRAGFSLETFEKLMKGGRGGRVVLPGNTEDSRLWHLVGKQEPIKMPPGQALITRTNHANLKTWIEEGAKFDGVDPKAPLRSLVPTEAELRAAELAKLSPEELLQLQAEQGAKLWKRAAQEEAPAKLQTEHALLFGNVAEDRLKKYSTEIDDSTALLAKVFKSNEKTMWSGKLTVFVFADRFTYAEFVQTIERRELLNEVTSHVRVKAPDEVYVCIQDLGDESNEQTPGTTGVVLSALTELFLQRAGSKVPDWVAQGTGLALAARSDLKNDYYRKLGATAGSRLLTLQKPEDLMKDGTFSPADLAPVGFSVVSYMLKQGEPQFVRFVSLLVSGKNLDESLRAVYNADSAKVSAAYLNSGSAGKAAPRKGKK